MERKYVIQLGWCGVVVGLVVLGFWYLGKEGERKDAIRAANVRTLGIVQGVGSHTKYKEVHMAYVVEGKVYKTWIRAYEVPDFERVNRMELLPRDSLMVIYNVEDPTEIFLDMASWYEYRNRVQVVPKMRPVTLPGTVPEGER